MSKLTTFTDDALIAFENMGDFATGWVAPTVRLGVTGLSRAGKTVFITALVNALLSGGRMPGFKALASGRLATAQLAQQPDPTVPRFDYEEHLDAVIEARTWPQSTRHISELRLVLTFQSEHFLARQLGHSRLIVDIVDYPGEWLLDLPLLAKNFAQWSAEAIARARSAGHGKQATPWLALIDQVDPNSAFDEPTAKRLHQTFADYLRQSRAAEHALSALPPGRFLMPGDLEGSPALTFSPLPLIDAQSPARDSLAAIMAERFEHYKAKVVRPFFRDHFARLDRQIVLVDALSAINAGADAVGDLEAALTDILGCFRPGAGSWLSSILSRRIDRILFAATKADHLHEDDHDDLEHLLEALVQRAIKRARFAGAKTDALAMAAVRATKQGRVKSGGEQFPAVHGEPVAGETLNGEPIDGGEVAIFPGDLPSNPKVLFDPSYPPGSLNFVRFRPPKLERVGPGGTAELPHIRLDRALEFLLGDKLQ